MATVLVFDIETIPDVVGMRRLNDYPDTLSDSEVVAKAMAEMAGNLPINHRSQK